MKDISIKENSPNLYVLDNYKGIFKVKIFPPDWMLSYAYVDDFLIEVA